MNTKKLLLLDKSALRMLNQDLRAQLDSKHTILYPPILFAEIAKDGLDEPKALFDFNNTVNVIHWAQRAKIDLLEGVPSGYYKIGAKMLTTVISGYSKADRRDLEAEAKVIVSSMEKEEERLIEHFSVLRKSGSEYPILELVNTHKDIPDEKIIRKFSQAVRQSIHSFQKYPISTLAKLKSEGRKGIARVRTILDRYQDDYDLLYDVSTLEKAQRWVEQIIYKNTESILLFLCDRSTIIPLSVNEQDEILNRFRKEGEPHINDFAPYARVATQLYLTIFLYLVENKENSIREGDLKDFEYLYYATDTNVIFISGDASHKRFIEEIPLLKNIQSNFKFLPQKKDDEEGFKRVLKSIGIRI